MSEMGYEGKKRSCQPNRLVYIGQRSRVFLTRSRSLAVLHVFALAAMPSAPEERANGPSQINQRSQAIQDGHWVLFRLPSGDVKNLQISKHSYVLSIASRSFRTHALKAPFLSGSLDLSTAMRLLVIRTGSPTISSTRSLKYSRPDLWTN